MPPCRPSVNYVRRIQEATHAVIYSGDVTVQYVLYLYKTWNPSRQEETFNFWEKKLRHRVSRVINHFVIYMSVIERRMLLTCLSWISRRSNFFYRNPYDRSYEKMKSLLSPNFASCVVSAPKNCFSKFRTCSASPTLVQVVASSQYFIGSNHALLRRILFGEKATKICSLHKSNLLALVGSHLLPP